MKPVVKVSIGRTAFTLEEGAYKQLKDYLDTLEAQFAGNPSGREIMDEIEVRIAELLLEKCGPAGVVNEQMVKEVCDTLGPADDIKSGDDGAGEAGSDGGSGSRQPDKDESARKERKLYRNPDDKVLGGVCSGMAAYFDKDVLLFRILAVAVFLFFVMPTHGVAFWVPVVLYLLLWLVIPEAKTVGQRYQMRGEKNTIDSIMVNVGKGAREMGDAAKDFNDKHPDVLRTLMRAVSVVVGSVFILVSVALLLGLVLCAVGLSAGLPLSIQNLTGSLIGMQSSTLATIALFVVLLVPVVALLYLGLCMCFRLRPGRLHLGLLLFLIWLAGVLTAGWLFARAAFEFESGERRFAETTVAAPQGSPLNIVMEGSARDYDYIMINADEDSYHLVMLDEGVLYIYPEITVRRDADADSVSIESSVINFTDKTREPEFSSYADGTLTLEPVVIDGSGRIDNADRDIVLTVPPSTELRVESPRYHDFHSRQYHTNIPFLR